jgi:hypothetical protein
MSTGNNVAPEMARGKGHSVIRWLPGAVSVRWRWKRLRIVLPFCVGLMLYATWYIPQRFPQWYSAVSGFVDKNPLFVVALSLSLIFLLLWFLLWRLPKQQVSEVWSAKDRIDLESKCRQALAQIVGGVVLLIGLYFTAQTLRTTQEGQITDRFEFIPIKSLAATGSDAPGNYAGHSRVPSPSHGRPASIGASGLSQCDSA